MPLLLLAPLTLAACLILGMLIFLLGGSTAPEPERQLCQQAACYFSEVSEVPFWRNLLAFALCVGIPAGFFALCWLTYH